MVIAIVVGVKSKGISVAIKTDAQSEEGKPTERSEAPSEDNNETPMSECKGGLGDLIPRIPLEESE